MSGRSARPLRVIVSEDAGSRLPRRQRFEVEPPQPVRDRGVLRRARGRRRRARGRRRRSRRAVAARAGGVREHPRARDRRAARSTASRRRAARSSPARRSRAVGARRCAPAAPTATRTARCTARELYQRLRSGHQPRLRSSLDTPFVVTRARSRARASARRRAPTAAGARRGGRQRPLVAAGACSLLAAPVPRRGCTAAAALELAFAGGTAWPNRLAALAGVALALVAAARVLLCRLPRGLGWSCSPALDLRRAARASSSAWPSADDGAGLPARGARRAAADPARHRGATPCAQSSGWLAGGRRRPRRLPARRPGPSGAC